MTDENTSPSEETNEETPVEASDGSPEQTPEQTPEEIPEATSEEAAEEVPEVAAEESTEDVAAEPVAAEEAPSETTVEHTYEELHGKTVTELRAIAEGIENDALHGYTTMHKENLLPALCNALGIEAHEHHEVVGVDKTTVKAGIQALKKERQAALASADGAELKRVRRKIRGLKRKLRKATV